MVRRCSWTNFRSSYSHSYLVARALAALMFGFFWYQVFFVVSYPYKQAPPKRNCMTPFRTQVMDVPSKVLVSATSHCWVLGL